MPRAPDDESLRGSIAKLAVNDTRAMVERLDLNTATREVIENTMSQMRNIASAAIARASTEGRKYHRDSLVNLDENNNPLVTILITRTA